MEIAIEWILQEYLVKIPFRTICQQPLKYVLEEKNISTVWEIYYKISHT